MSNALYGLYKMFSESHAPGIQILTNQNAPDSNCKLWALFRALANASAIATENASRSRYEPSVHEESSILKHTKNVSILHSPEKN